LARLSADAVRRLALRRLAIFSLLLVALSPDVCRAARIDISFAGRVEKVSLGLRGGSLASGQPVAGTITLETAESNVSSYPLAWTYPLTVISFDLTIGPYAVSSPGLRGPNNFVRVSHGDGVPPSDMFIARAPVQGLAVNGFSPELVQFGVFAFGTSVLSGISFPTVAEINAFASAPGYQPFNDINSLILGPQRVDWLVTSFVATPEPAPAVLVLVGLLGLVGASTRLRRREARRREIF
jgi:hypothetical protein